MASRRCDLPPLLRPGPGLDDRSDSGPPPFLIRRYEIAALVSLTGFALASLLLGGGLGKLRPGVDADARAATALGRIIHGRKALAVTWRGAALAEVGVAVLLLTADPGLAGTAAATLFACASVYAAVAMRVAPGRPCGCFASAHGRVTPRTVVRAFLLLGAAALYAAEGDSEWRHVADWRAWVFLAGLTVAIIAASPEVSALRQWLVTRDVLPACGRVEVSEAVARDVVMQTRAWGLVEPYLLGAVPASEWRQGCWHYLSFRGEHEGRVATAVFALRGPPGRCTCTAFLRRGLTGPPILQAPEERVPWPWPLRVRALLPPVVLRALPTRRAEQIAALGRG